LGGGVVQAHGEGWVGDMKGQGGVGGGVAVQAGGLGAERESSEG